MDIQYTSQTIDEGGMRCHSIFIPSQDSFATDVAEEIGGRGKHPTPGEMLAACVASCMLSMIAYTGTQKGFETKGITIKAACGEGSRGIGSLTFDITIPMPTTPSVRKFIEGAVSSCPVGNSLHPDITKKMIWHWADET